MKKLTLVLLLVMVVVLASFRTQVTEWMYPEKTTSKSISLNVSAGSAYEAKEYKNSVARLQLTIIKVKGNETEVLWENEYPELELRKFPLNQAFTQKIRITEVLDSKEQIIVHYTITYKTNESVLTVQNQKQISKGKSEEELEINI